MVTIQLTLPDVYVYTCEKTGLSTNIDCKKTPVESHLAAWTIGVREKFDNCHASETLKKYNDGVVPVKDSAEHKRAWNARIPAVKKILADYLVAWYAGNPGRPARTVDPLAGRARAVAEKAALSDDEIVAAVAAAAAAKLAKAA